MEAEAALGLSLPSINSSSPKTFAAIILISLPFPALGGLGQIELTEQRDADLSQAVIPALICFRGEILLSFLYKYEITNKQPIDLWSGEKN